MSGRRRRKRRSGRTGLRIGDATRLQMDCLVPDPQGAVYLHYRKPQDAPRRGGPIDDELAAMIQAQQAYSAAVPGSTGRRQLGDLGVNAVLEWTAHVIFPPHDTFIVVISAEAGERRSAPRPRGVAEPDSLARLGVQFL